MTRPGRGARWTCIGSGIVLFATTGTVCETHYGIPVSKILPRLVGTLWTYMTVWLVVYCLLPDREDETQKKSREPLAETMTREEQLRTRGDLATYIGLPDGELEICVSCWNDRELIERIDRETEEEIREAGSSPEQAGATDG